MEKYEEIKIEVIEFASEDIITESIQLPTVGQFFYEIGSILK